MIWYFITYCALQQWYSRTICAQTMHDLEQHCFRVCSSISDTSRHPMFSSRQLYSKLSSRGGPSWCLPHSQRHRYQSETRKDLISGVATCLTFQMLKPREPFEFHWISSSSSLCKKVLMGMVMVHVCVDVAASLQLRICSDICLILYTCELPLLILVRGKRLLKDGMVILDIASCMKSARKSN